MNIILTSSIIPNLMLPPVYVVHWKLYCAAYNVYHVLGNMYQFFAKPAMTSSIISELGMSEVVYIHSIWMTW